jgi:lysozyme family protein
MSLCIFFKYCPGRRKAAFLLEHTMTAENFQACLAFTLKYEGGRSNDPRDPGGRTMEGVTQATYDAHRVKKALGRRDVFTMGAAERDEIYRNEYWDLINGDVMRAGEDLCVFDFAVNSGPARAKSFWARAGGNRRAPVADVIHQICAHRLSFLHALRTWSYFGAGWGRRVAACEATALQMAGASLPTARDRANATKKRHGSAPVIAGIGVGTAWALHALVHAAGWVIIAVGAVAATIMIAMAFSHWRHGQRVDALTAAIKDMQARAVALKVSLAAEASQKAAVAANIDKQQQQLKTAEAAEAALRNAPPQSARSAWNEELKK